MSQTTLLSMTKDEAVVADNVTTYKRKDIEEQYAILSEQVKADSERLPALRQEVKVLEHKLEENSRTLDLYKALLDRFNSQYPFSDTDKNSATEEVTSDEEEKTEPVEE